MITVEQFTQLFPRAIRPEGWVATFENLLPLHGIDSPERIAAFISQCGVETMGWRVFEENLNYSAPRLVEIFKLHFQPPELADQYARKPAAIGNRVYANRMGNGDEQSGDGWKYRGRGPIHLTGRRNYTDFAQALYRDTWQDIVNNPDRLVLDPEVSLASALWFWDINNLNDLADAQDIKMLTRKVNGGYNGLDDRVQLYGAVMQIL